MTVAELLDPIQPPEALARREAAGLAYDSRNAGPGFLFFAFAGKNVDGAKFAAQALERGALAVVSESPRPEDFSGPWIQVEHGRRALAMAARRFYGEPDERIAVTGLTGTNGKTTTCYLLDAVLRAAGKVTATLGTIEYTVAGRAVSAVNTTPESVELFRLFAELETAGGTHATMEVSSHGLALGRVYGVRFHTAVFSNLTRDHLDYHETMERYFAAKRMLFEGAGAPAPPFAVVNQDDPYGREIAVGAHTEILRYGLHGGGVRAVNVHSSFDGLRFEIHRGRDRWEAVSPLPGKMNVYNILAAWSAALTYGIPPETIARGIAECRGAPGRFEKVDAGQPFLVVVDYAHTDDALRNVIGVARSLNPKRVLTLFGCGGDRDRTKRPLMGAAAGELSDFVTLTSDNPRTEDPLTIINDAMVGLRRCDTPYIAEPDREKAIRFILRRAEPGDVVILAGKGHETYQILKTGRVPFDDREAARRILREMGYER